VNLLEVDRLIDRPAHRFVLERIFAFDIGRAQLRAALVKAEPDGAQVLSFRKLEARRALIRSGVSEVVMPRAPSAGGKAGACGFAAWMPKDVQVLPAAAVWSDPGRPLAATP
jgi:hypothetical protein